MVRKRKDDFSNYMNKALQQSMLTGIPQIAKAKYLPKKAFRSLVFCLCIAGYIYQSLSFMWLYWEYDVVTEVRVGKPSRMDWPGFTLCVENGFIQNAFCGDPKSESVRKKYNLSCYQFDEEYVNDIGMNDVCEYNPTVCLGNSSIIERQYLKNYENLYTVPRKEIEPWMYGAVTISKRCLDKNAYVLVDPVTKQREVVQSMRDDHYLDYGCQSSSGKWRETCASMNTLVGRPDHKLPKALAITVLKCRVYDKTRYMPWRERINRIFFSLHSRYSIKNPFTSAGFALPSDASLYLYPTLEKRNLLPYPYKTDCRDYMPEWRERGGRGAITAEECVLECKRNASIEKYGCVTKEVFMPEYYGPDPRCGREVPLGTLEEDGADCIKNCKPACYEEKYTLKKISITSNYRFCDEDSVNYGDKKFAIFIDFSSMEEVTYSYKPKYDTIEVFSYLGGYIGMWLGISLVAVFDFFDMLFTMGKYSLRRVKQFTSERVKHDRIHQMQKQTQ